MQQNFHEELLNFPISQLQISEEFKAVSEQCNFETLADILKDEGLYKVFKRKDFGYRMFFEMVQLLKLNGLSHYLN